MKDVRKEGNMKNIFLTGNDEMEVSSGFKYILLITGGYHQGLKGETTHPPEPPFFV
jgi:hypothetical protein